MSDPRRQAFDRLDRARRDACDAGDHGAEAQGAAALLASADPRSTADLILATIAHLRALEHLTGSAENEGDRSAALDRWHAAAAAAYAALDEHLEEDEASPNARRAAFDPVASSLRRAQVEAGVDLSPPAADLARRERARGGPRPESPTFFARHREGITAIWARDGRAWWHDRFVARFGSEPPDDWWLDDPTTATGGQVAPHSDAEQWFDEGDLAEFLAEIEARYREETGLPARGQGRVSEVHLVRCVETALPDVEIVRQARPPWLGAGQSLDVFIPSLALAIEYQGEQHYVPLEHWGAEARLTHRRELDERKRDACLRAGVRLVEWRYDEAVTVGAVRSRLGLSDSRNGHALARAESGQAGYRDRMAANGSDAGPHREDQAP